MNFLEIAQSRYTTKAYRGGKIADEKIAELKNILRLSPSSINSQPWQFVFVSDETQKAAFAEVSAFNKEKINHASHLVIFRAVDDIALFEKQISENLTETQSAYFQRVIKPGSDEEIKNWFQKQVYLSLGFFLSACAVMGIDSTPMEGIDTEQYDRILSTQTGYKTLFAAAIGYRNPEDSNQPEKTPKQRLPLERVVKDFPAKHTP